MHVSSKKNVPIEFFKLSFESTENKQQLGATTTGTEARLKKSYGKLKFYFKNG